MSSSVVFEQCSRNIAAFGHYQIHGVLDLLCVYRVMAVHQRNFLSSTLSAPIDDPIATRVSAQRAAQMLLRFDSGRIPNQVTFR